MGDLKGKRKIKIFIKILSKYSNIACHLNSDKLIQIFDSLYHHRLHQHCYHYSNSNNNNNPLHLINYHYCYYYS